MYEGVRDVLQKYRSGKLPKAFKMIPHLQNWEQILYITEPTTWSAAAMYQVNTNSFEGEKGGAHTSTLKIFFGLIYLAFLLHRPHIFCCTLFILIFRPPEYLRPT